MYTKYHTWNEILQQPQMWQETYNIIYNMREQIASFVKK